MTGNDKVGDIRRMDHAHDHESRVGRRGGHRSGRMRVDVDSQDDNDSSGSVKDLAHESKKKMNRSDV